MIFGFLDESGDAGGKGTKYIVLAAMLTKDKKKIVKIIRNIKRRLLQKNKTARWLNRNNGEIKYHNFPDKNLLKTALRKLVEVDMQIYFMAFDKKGITFDKSLKSSILTQVLEYIFEHQTTPYKIIADIDFFNRKKVNYFLLTKYKRAKIIDKNGKKANELAIDIKEIDDDSYRKFRKEGFLHLIKTEHQKSRLFEELQALDLISGSIFANVEHNTPVYFDIIKKKVRGTVLK